MVGFRHTVAAETAVFRPSGLAELAGATDFIRAEEGMVEGIVVEALGLVGVGDVVGLVDCRAVREIVRREDDHGDGDDQAQGKFGESG